MAPEDWLQAKMQGEIVALVHSHPGGLPWLSEADRRLQVQSDLPWWLVCRGAIHKFRCVPHRAWHASAFTGICNDLAAASTFV